MADELTCTSEAIQKFVADNGGKVSNQELVKHFKKFLSGPNSLPNARAIFKDYVNAVASIKVEDGVKYIILKKRGYEGKSDTSSSSEQISEDSKNDSKKCRLSDDKESAKNKETSNQSNILHSHSSPSILGMASPQAQNADHAVPAVTSPIFWSSDLPPGHVPQPPPRRKYSMKGKENRGTKYEESIRQIYEEKETTTSPRNEEIREVVSPGSVKEKAHLLNKMATESDIIPKQPYVPSRRREHRDDKSPEDDACSISTLDPRRKEWILKASRADYHELVRLLREEPKLAFVKTALHWAAKHGNLDVIKLMAGTYKLDTNARTGYTPLHLAAMFGREEIMEVLINTYGADSSIRDYSGKRPLHYLPKSQAERFLSLFPTLSYPVLLFGKPVVAKGEKEPSLMRMGSLNSKVKKPSVLSASGRAITRMKSWGSADNIPDRAMNLMPPPKTFPKKKKSRKHADIIGISENWRGRTPDSDSDSATGLAA
ncbi:ankyrin repeat domain-containing protein SOWAHB-like [Argiope bruennichi]|uniref:ankyrin repeat domain-containing protein SOWAHB-like n=1 Tax=Argiope bruennichi TaxID=94029 RepID=UPI00249467EC|nr:ankyrin repeat domain-containing protein SOWAHB-like [Argiope bruennichi]